MGTQTISPLAAIAAKVRAGERLSEADGLTLATTRDIHTLGQLADEVRQRRHGKLAFYNVNRHINYTNICALRCKFCYFCRLPGDPDAYELTNDQIARTASQAFEAGATEVHITGGLHPAWRIEHYEEMLRAVRSAAPALHIKAFTAAEIAHFAWLSHVSPAETLQRLVDAGLDSLPGGGAEIFDPKVHDEAFAAKIGAEDWFAIHRAAHKMGLKSNATMLYGHVETPAQRVAHLLRLRQLQDETGGFQCLVPLSFIPGNSAWRDLPGPTGLDDLRTLALGRLMLDNFQHVKSFWIMHGIKLSQLALDWGVDDLDGTVVWYDITKTRSTGTHQELTAADMARVIRQAGRIPVERDSLYRRVFRDSLGRRMAP